MSIDYLEQELQRLRYLYKASNSDEEKNAIVTKANLIKKAQEWQLPVKTKTFQEEQEANNQLLKNAVETLL